MDQVKAQIAAVLQAVAHGDKRYRYTSPFLTDMVRWDQVKEDIAAILDRYVHEVEWKHFVQRAESAAAEGVNHADC